LRGRNRHCRAGGKPGQQALILCIERGAVYGPVERRKHSERAILERHRHQQRGIRLEPESAQGACEARQ